MTMIENHSKTLMLFTDLEEHFLEVGEEGAGKLIISAFAYFIRGEEPAFEDKALRIVWRDIKASLDRNREKYESGRKTGKRRAAAKLKSGYDRVNKAVAQGNMEEAYSLLVKIAELAEREGMAIQPEYDLENDACICVHLHGLEQDQDTDHHHHQGLGPEPIQGRGPKPGEEIETSEPSPSASTESGSWAEQTKALCDQALETVVTNEQDRFLYQRRFHLLIKEFERIANYCKFDILRPLTLDSMRRAVEAMTIDREKQDALGALVSHWMETKKGYRLGCVIFEYGANEESTATNKSFSHFCSGRVFLHYLRIAEQNDFDGYSERAKALRASKGIVNKIQR